MKFYQFLILAYLSFHSVPSAWADIDSEFKSFYYSSQIDSRKCGANVDAFVKQLIRTGSLPQDFKRVVIRAPKSRWHMENMLIAVGSRFGRAEEGGNRLSFWYFHVVGVSKNKVYDFSFAEGPRVVARDQYLREMFVPRTPFMIFGRGFKIGGKGPYYAPADGAGELADYRFEVSRVDSSGRAGSASVFESAADFLRN